MTYTAYLYTGFVTGEGITVNLGMSREEIVKLLGEPQDRIESADYYSDFRIDYSNTGEAAAFEFFPSSGLKVVNEELPSLSNVNLFGFKLNKLNKALKSYDPDIITDEASVVSLKYGIGTYGEDKNCEAVIIFRRGYYDGVI